jgi:hypothetical protein
MGNVSGEFMKSTIRSTNTNIRIKETSASGVNTGGLSARGVKRGMTIQVPKLIPINN